MSSPKRTSLAVVALLGLSACAPAVTPARVSSDVLFQVRANRVAAQSSVSGGFVHTFTGGASGYTLRYYLGSLPEEVAPASIKLELANTGDDDVRILWEESRFTYPSGTVSRVIHQGVRYRERGKPLAPTSVQAGGRHRDLAVPSQSIRLDSGGYRATPLYSLEHRRSSSFSLSLVLEVGGVSQTVLLQWEGKGEALTAR